MERRQVAEVMEAFIVLREWYEQPPLSDELVQAYAEDLQDLPYEGVRETLRKMRRDPRRHKAPSPAEIRSLVQPEVVGRETECQAISGRINKAITKFGYNKPQLAREFIGEIGWQICEERGGWRHLCGTLEVTQLGTFIAQCRDAARAKLELGIKDTHKKPELPPKGEDMDVLPAPEESDKQPGSTTIKPAPIAQILASLIDSEKAKM